MKLKSNIWKFVALFVVLLLVVGAYMIFFVAPQAVANLALQVNPAITLTLDEWNIVIDVKGLDERGELLLAEIDVIDKQVPDALHIIAEALRKAGLLEDGRQILIALHPVEDRIGEAELIALTGIVHQTLDGYIAEHGLVVEVTNVVLTAELADAVRVAGLFPADYVDLVIEVGSPMVTQVLKLQKELGINLTLFKEEFGTIGAALIDMKEAGITGDNALAILNRSLEADPKLEEITTITAAMIDLVEEGLSKDEALARIQAAIKADPTLQDFDDLIEVPEYKEIEDEVKPALLGVVDPDAVEPNAVEPAEER